MAKLKQLVEIETFEHQYFNQIHFTLTTDLDKMIKSLNSKDKIKNKHLRISSLYIDNQFNSSYFTSL